MKKIALVFASILVLVLTGEATAFDEKAVAEFYKGKTVRLIVGFSAGGSTDLYTRLIARQLSKHIPGEPSVIVENRPGGGGVAAANLIYVSDPADGTVIGATSTGFILTQLLGVEGVRYDVTKVHWLASSTVSIRGCFARTDSGVDHIRDIIGEGAKELTMAAEGVGHFTQLNPAIMNAALGTNFRIVTGYRGGGPIRLALEQKEVDGACSSLQEALSHPDLYVGDPPIAKFIVVMGAKTSDNPLLRGVPAAQTLAKTDKARQLLQANYGPAAMGKPYWVAPDVPMDRVAALRMAFGQALSDPAYLAEAKKAKLVPDPKDGEEVTEIVKGILATPAATVKMLADIAKKK